MPNREQYIESILQSTHAIRRQFIACASAQVPTGKNKVIAITPSQWAVLAIVMKSENIGQKNIIETLNITSSAATQLVNELVRKGYLIRSGGTKDRRTLSLELSSACKMKMRHMKERRLKQLTEVFDGLNNKELAQYAEINRKIACNILDKK